MNDRISTLRHNTLRSTFMHAIQVMLALFLSSYLIALTSAQVPTPVTGMEYATRDETTLYIQGGTPNNGLPVSNQLYALDLTRPSWNTTNPPWSALSVGSGLQASPITYLQSMVISKDQQSLSIWDTLGSISTYNITSNTWSNPASLPPSTKKVTKLNAAMDPTSGLIYLPSGFESGAVNVYAMMVYNPATRAALSLPMPSDESTLAGLAYFSLVWSTARSSMLLYGGVSVVNFTVSTPSFFEFLPAAAMWAPVKTTGTSPGQVYNHCMVPAYGGTKMIVFGGRYTSGVDSGSIYILDVKTMVWTQGTAADPSQNRTGMACTVAGDNFVAWGGDYNASTSKFTAPIIYNLKSNQWTTQFSLAPSPSITSSTGAPSSTSASAAANGPNGPSAAAIGGGVVGAIVALVLGIFLFKYCRRTRAQGAEDSRSQPLPAQKSNMPPSDNLPPSTSTQKLEFTVESLNFSDENNQQAEDHMAVKATSDSTSLETRRHPQMLPSTGRNPQLISQEHQQQY